jgi:hypothetical protein
MATSSYITVKNALEQFAENHLVIKRFKTSFFEQIDNFSTADNTFPILYVVPSDVTFEQYTDRFFFRIYCVDILQKDRSNESAILNDTLLTLRDLYNWLKIADNGLNVLSTARAIPVNNFLVDYTAGWYLDVEVEGLAESNDCSIPFTDNFTLTGYTCDFTYASRFLTCETLEECQAIIDINDRIDGIIVSADTFTVNGSYDNSIGTLFLVRNDGELIPITGFTTGSTGPDIYVTGGTFNAGTETLTLSRNDNQTVEITGFTSGVEFDVFVTGGTYSAGTAVFTNNTGGTFNVSGFSTVESVTDDGNGVCTVDNTDPSNPIIGFNGVYVDGTTITGHGTIGNPLKATLVPGKNLVLYLDSVDQNWTATALSGDILTSPITTTQTTVTSTANSNTRNVINFISGPDFFESTIIPDGFWLMHLYGSRNNGTVSFYTDIYYVDNDGVSNKTLIASGAGDPAPITNTVPIMLTQSLFSDVILLSDTNKRLIIEVFVITGSGNRTTTFYFRDDTISHIHTPLTVSGGTGGGGNSIGQLTGDVTAGPASASSQSVVSTVKPNLKTGSFGITIDGLGGVISSGQKGYVSIPYNGTITGWDIFSDAIGSCVIDVWKDSFGNFPPTVGDSIAGTQKPTLSGQTANRNNNLTGWTTTITAGDVIGFNVEASPTGTTRVNLIIKTIKS